MKRIFLSAMVLGLVTVTTVNAKPLTNATVIVADNQDETPVKQEDLPEPVKTSLASDDYKDWEFVSAVSFKKEEATFYKITLKKGEESKTVTMDAEGKVAAE